MSIASDKRVTENVRKVEKYTVQYYRELETKIMELSDSEGPEIIISILLALVSNLVRFAEQTMKDNNMEGNLANWKVPG